MMKSGITCFADMWLFADVTAEAVKGSGLRALIAPYGQNLAAADIETFVSSSRKWNDDRVTPALGIAFPETCSNQALEKIAAASRRNDLKIEMHAGNPEHFAARPWKNFDEIGLLGPRTILADCVYATSGEIDLAASCGASVAYTPIADSKFGAGVAPLARIRESMHVGLGTDSVGNVDLFDEMRLVLLIDRGLGLGAGLEAEDALALATMGGARTLGLDSLIGSLEAGKRADLTVVNLGDSRFTPLHLDRSEQVVSHLVFVGSASDVDTVIVNGRILVRDGVAQGIDESELIAKSREMSHKCFLKAGLA
jgi:5-methylthioadenosine/S-adenosylhomocysteine deaminase